MRRSPRMVALTALLALAVAPAAAARARIPPAAVPWVAQYSLEVAGGSQNGSWTEHHAAQPPCDGGQTGSGSEDVTLSPHGSAPVFASGVGPTLTSIEIAAPTDLPNPAGPFAVPHVLLTAGATMNREGSLQDGAAADPSQCPSGDGGGASTPAQPDCGAKTDLLKLWFQKDASFLHFEQPPDTALTDPYQDCPYLGPGMFPDWTAMDVVLPLSGWGPPPPIGSSSGPGVPVQLHGQASAEQHDADIDASANERLTLRFTPIVVTPTIVLGDVRSERVDRKGRLTVPVRCPAGERGGCGATLALAIDVAGASAARTALPAAFTVAKASFRIRAGRRARVVLRIAHASRTYLRALAQAPLALAVTVGRRHPIRYVAAQTHLRV